MNESGIEIFYDGECPFCSSYVRMLELRRQVGRVELIDARSPDHRLADLRKAGLKLDEGMAVRFGGELFHGPDAVWLLAHLSEPSGGPRAVLRWLVSTPRRARVLYPVMRAGRTLALWLTGRPRLT